MRPNNTSETSFPELRPVSAAEIARILEDARRMRDAAAVELLRAAGRSISRRSRALVTLVATGRSAHGGMKNA